MCSHEEQKTDVKTLVFSQGFHKPLVILQLFSVQPLMFSQVFFNPGVFAEFHKNC